MPDVKQLVDDNLSKVSGYVGEDRVKASFLSTLSREVIATLTIAIYNQIVREVYAELADIGKSNKSVEEKTKAAKALVEEKLGTTSQFASSAADKATDLAGGAKKWLDGAVPGLGGLTKVSSNFWSLTFETARR